MSPITVDVSQNGQVSTSNSIFEIGDEDFSRLSEKPKPINTERKRSFDEKSFSELSITMSPRPFYRNSENSSRVFEPVDSIYSSGGRSGFDTPRSENGFEPHPIVAEAWEALRRSIVYFRKQPVGTIAALDHSEEKLNYDQVFVRDFVPSALAFLMNGEPDIVKNFLIKALRLQSWEKKVDLFKLGEGVMPASFKVHHDPIRNTETLVADFGEAAIGRVAPVDSGFWWIILLRAYTKSTGDSSLADMPECQRGIRLILSICLSEGFDTFPTLLCADGCCMIDRRMGIHGYPIEIQALFFMALRCALQLLKPEGEGKEFIEKVVERLHALSFHMRNYYWLDLKQLNCIYRYKTEEYSHTAVNKFNVMPDSLPDWVFDFMPTKGGYFIGNQAPLMIVKLLPLGVLLWLLTAACIKSGRPQIAKKAIELAESRLLKDGWPEYYDGKTGRYIGKQARKHQTWSIAGYLVAKMMLEDPSHVGMVSLEEDKQMCPRVKRSASWTC
ncbi:hypothetical protein Cgig2_029094 [Carnegiea gigantea]|uniref:Alkaline/neutral invertase n=1 Tax=Carnegiea gigantea TaxID=171969 RepID=A0A9Q1KAB6_9CARY|nr:hypothetical protein Cgig2_029094 [Carnegiea gigantea]